MAKKFFTRRADRRVFVLRTPEEKYLEQIRRSYRLPPIKETGFVGERRYIEEIPEKEYEEEYVIPTAPQTIEGDFPSERGMSKRDIAVLRHAVRIREEKEARPSKITGLNPETMMFERCIAFGLGCRHITHRRVPMEVEEN